MSDCMKVIQEQKTFSRVYTVKRYQDVDGTVFEDEQGCLAHDFQVLSNRIKPPVSAGYVQSLYDDCYPAELILLETREDYDYVVAQRRFKAGQLDTDFFDCGEGWYLCWTEDGGDCADSHYIKNYNCYLEEAKKNLDEWIETTTDAIANADKTSL